MITNDALAWIDRKIAEATDDFNQVWERRGVLQAARAGDRNAMRTYIKAASRHHDSMPPLHKMREKIIATAAALHTLESPSAR